MRKFLLQWLQIYFYEITAYWPLLCLYSHASTLFLLYMAMPQNTGSLIPCPLVMLDINRPIFFKSLFSDSCSFSVTLFRALLNMTHLIINSFKIYHTELTINAQVSSEEYQEGGLWRTFISDLSAVVPSIPTNNSLNSHWGSLSSHLGLIGVRLPTYPNLYFFHIFIGI